ncbi:MAG TPA: hypothetical protein VMK82_04580 [Steroidobacteraceae bacterium]|nr:hypothetical protein [Steroidobacteraceae bacterium]
MRTVHTAGAGAAALLQRMTRRAQVVLPGSRQAQGEPVSWLSRLRERLPEEQQAHVTEVLEKAGELVLFADSAAWAGRIRLSLPALAEVSAGRRITVRLMPQRRERP